MAGIFPHPSADARNFRPGDPVKWFITEKDISPYIGRVTEICPKINKIWVDFQVGGNQQMDPMDLILIPPTQGLSPIKEETGYSNYDKTVSKENFGDMETVLSGVSFKDIAKKKAIKKMASEVVYKFATEVTEKLSTDILGCMRQGMSDIQAYQELYPRYEKSCSDGFMRIAIDKIYNADTNDIRVID